MNPDLILKFQQQLKLLQINAAMGVDIGNIDKIQLACEQLEELATALYYQVYPPRPPRDDIDPNALEIVEIDIKPAPPLVIK